MSLDTRIPFSALVEEDEAVLATYRRNVDELKREEEQRRG